jgi:hypothetical protein
MKTLQWILAGIVIGVVAVAFREFDLRRWLAPISPTGTIPPDGREPVLGYDGMDQETLLEWLPEADLDADVLNDMIRYEEANLGREPVLEALEEMLS